MPQGTSNLAFRNNRAYRLEHLERIMGRNSELAQFLSVNSLSMVRIFDDFNGDTINLDHWALTTGAGGTAFAQRVNDAEGTMIQGATGVTNNTAISIQGARHWQGDRNCLIEVRWKISAVTAYQFEMGFADVTTDAGLPVVTDVDVPTTGNGASDLAVVHLDTTQTLTTMAFVTDGSTAGMNATKTDLGTRNMTAAAWKTMRIGIVDDSAFCMVWDSDDPQALVLQEEAYHGDTTARSVEGGTMLFPFFLGRTRSAADRVFDIDYILVAGNR